MGRLIILVISILPKMIYRFNTTSTKILAGVLLVNTDNQILILIGKEKGTRIVKTIWIRQRKSEDSNWLIWRLTIIRMVWYLWMHTQRSMQQKRESKNRPTQIWSIGFYYWKSVSYCYRNKLKISKGERLKWTLC